MEEIKSNRNRDIKMDDPKLEDRAERVLDSSYPLMVCLREKASGTYGHSKNVSALMEALAAELGLNVLYMKIAGFYHDIGKTVNPLHFGENQTDETGNIHDDLEPRMSYGLISRHVAETTQILINDENFPVEIIRWCSQHHGSSVMRFFCDKSGTKNEDSYRYHTLPPRSLESGLLMLCDRLEAQCRAMFQADKLTSVEEIINRVMDDLSADGQWDDISLHKFSYLRMIKEVLCRELESMYKPKRVDYDKASRQNGAE